jgi:hypothetical protein
MDTIYLIYSRHYEHLTTLILYSIQNLPNTLSLSTLFREPVQESG